MQDKSVNVKSPKRVAPTGRTELKPCRPEYTTFGAEVVYHFPAKGDAQPITLTWYEGAPEVLLPPDFEDDRDLAPNGMYIMGDNAAIMTFGPQANNPAVVPETRMKELAPSLPPKTIPRLSCGPVEEWIRAIKGEGPLPGSNFEYAAPLTELVLLGTLAIRSGRTIKWDPAAMQVTNAPELNRYLDITAREGWAFR